MSKTATPVHNAIRLAVEDGMAIEIAKKEIAGLKQPTKDYVYMDDLQKLLKKHKLSLGSSMTNENIAESNTELTVQQVKDFIKPLAKSQGSYGRIVAQLDKAKNGWEKLTKEVNKQGCKDVVDVILYLEG